MVFQKRMESGSIGYKIPKKPRFPRSARGKPSPPKKVEVSQMRPFDLLATVAEELLLAKKKSCRLLYEAEETTSTINKIKKEQFDTGSSLKSDVFDQGSCDESSFVARFVSRGQVTFNFEEHLSSPEERTAASTLALVKCHVSEKNAFIGIHNLEDPVDLDAKSTALVSSDSGVEIPPIGGHHSAGGSSFSSVRGDIELLVNKDDDENSSGRTHGSNMYARAFKPHCTGDGRVRKLTKSKYWKPSREAMDYGELWNDDEEIKPVFRSRKLCYTRQRTKRSSFKRSKLFEGSTFSSSNGGFRSKAVSDPFVKDCMKLDYIGTHADLSNAHGRSGSTTGHTPSYEPVENHVKLSIKSFRVPELFIEIPANATIGSLKRTVMEAVTAILSGGLHVGVHLKGKKIKDDNKTILQAGISDTDKLDNLGFTLEPNLSRIQHHNSCISDPEPLTKIHSTLAPAIDIGTFNAVISASDCTESDHDSVHSPTNPSTIDKMANNSKALVPILALNPVALAAVPLSNSKASEIVQRRIRRPFSVPEVEALVLAVEKLGTGRWRDVKLRAFENAKHRTYVDLKDKWKTLVHTARISPQQRRGEPVPQELLDRVLSAHAYWSRQQAKSARLAERCHRPV
ncbi:Telomere repeat-binding protein 3 [Platanthera zijinensis]|uniref:Telomere repeat-binding protein 3 n=1 Tax=Platanthera zijinensis TaxID=2320716 RepID=A0AAP0B404_9ASPA